MQKLIGLALVCALAAAGCKSSSSDSSKSAGGDQPTATESAGKPAGRSGKIDLGARRPSLPGDPDKPEAAEGSDAKPALQDRRNARMAEFDTDHDGKISDEERKVARHKRAEDMLKTADKNGDGKVSPDELAEGNFRRLDPATIDADKDGNVSADELEAALEARGRAWGAGRFGRGDRANRMGQMGRLGGKANPNAGSAAAPAPTEDK